MIISREECLFELNTVAQSLFIDIEAALRKSSEDVSTISFSFRTDRPTQPFFNIQSKNQELIRIDLIDGKIHIYMVFINLVF